MYGVIRGETVHTHESWYFLDHVIDLDPHVVDIPQNRSPCIFYSAHEAAGTSPCPSIVTKAFPISRMVLLESDLEGRLGQLELQHRTEPDSNVLGCESNEKVNCRRVEVLRDDQCLDDEARVEENLHRKRCLWGLERKYLPCGWRPSAWPHALLPANRTREVDRRLRLDLARRGSNATTGGRLAGRSRLGVRFGSALSHSS